MRFYFRKFQLIFKERFTVYPGQEDKMNNHSKLVNIYSSTPRNVSRIQLVLESKHETCFMLKIFVLYHKYVYILSVVDILKLYRYFT